MSDWLELNGQCAVITGGALGIGRAVAEGLCAAGVHVVIADFNAEAGQKAADELSASGTEALFVSCNVAESESVAAAFATACERFGRVDILVNNAGINVPRLLVDPNGQQELTADVWDKVFAVNCKGQFLCAQAAARGMLADGKGGVIIMINSESGMEGSEGQSVYAATKAAGYNMTRSWAKELGKHGIRVVGVAPGIMEATALRSEAYEKSLAYTRGKTVDELRAGYLNKSTIPLGRDGKLSEVADLVCYLASSRSSYVHGTTVNLSGGKSRA
jgi:sorbitol-6-phosphate 2-dehydrogenase